MIYKITFDTYFENDKIVKQANLNFSELKNLWFKFPKSVADDLTDRADPFVYALSLPMMTQGGTFEFDGNISKSVIDNIVMYSRAMNALNPEKYKHLVVRVAGYSALFTTLSRSLQDDIIRRTEQGF